MGTKDSGAKMKKLERSAEIIPSKRVCEEFRLIYELKEAQKAINFFSPILQGQKDEDNSRWKKSWERLRFSHDYETYYSLFQKEKQIQCST